MKLYIGSYFTFFTSENIHWVEIELQEPTRLTDILSELGIPAGEVHLVVLNDELVESPEIQITNDDVVRLYPAVNGG
jgi:sulfur carrier protein ThiS